MRKAKFPKAGYIFQHKTNKEAFARELYLATGESLTDWQQITEEEFAAIIAEQEAKREAERQGEQQW